MLLISSSSASKSASASGHFAKKPGSTFSTCFLEVQFSMRHATRIFHSSGQRSSCIKLNGLLHGGQHIYVLNIHTRLRLFMRLNNCDKKFTVKTMFKKACIVTSVVFLCSCFDLASDSKQGDLSVLAPEEPPGSSRLDGDPVPFSVTQCTECAASAREACSDEFAECEASAACRAWLDCSDACVANDRGEECHGSCDKTTEEYYTPRKLKNCVCDVCCAQCFYMCPM